MRGRSETGENYRELTTVSVIRLCTSLILVRPSVHNYYVQKSQWDLSSIIKLADECGHAKQLLPMKTEHL